VQGLGVAALDHRSYVLQHHVGARALRQAVADLLADDLVLRGELLSAQALHFGVGHLDADHRHPGLVEERYAGGVVDEVAAGTASLVRGHVLLERGRCRLHRHRLAQQLTQMQLLRVGQRRVALALLAEDLAPEPFDLGAQPLDLRGLRAQQLRHVLHVHGGQFRRIGHAREHCV